MTVSVPGGLGAEVRRSLWISLCAPLLGLALTTDGHGQALVTAPRFATLDSILLAGPPEHHAVGDLDGDGYLDLVVTVASGLQALNGSPSGLQPGWQGAALLPLTLHLADVDLDGHLDILTGSFGLLDVRRGDGQGGFLAPLAITLPLGFYFSIATGDLDADGLIDAVLERLDTGELILVRAVGTGLHSSFSTIAQSASVQHPLAIVDLDNDGHQDVVVGCSPQVRILRGLGGAAFAPEEVLADGSPQDWVLADLDLDGRLDLVLPGTTLRVARQLPSGQMDVPQDIAIPTTQPITLVVTQDLDGDGVLDLVVGDSARLWSLIGDGLGGFGPALEGTALGAGSSWLAVADFDGNGSVEAVFPAGLVQQAGAGYRLFVAEADNTGRFSGPRMTAEDLAQARALVSDDFDGDGFPDLAIVSCGQPGNLCVLRLLRVDPSGQLVLDTEIALGTAGPLVSLASADFNGDGVMDHVIGRPSGEQLLIVSTLAGGATNVQDVTSPCPGPVEAHFADLDGDGLLDLTIACASGLGTLRQDPVTRTFIDGARIELVDGSTSVALADLDGDGLLDTISTGSGATPLRLFLSALGTGAPPVELALPGMQPTAVRAGDLDDDGFADLVVTSRVTRNLLVLRGASGGGLLPQPVVSFTAAVDGPRIVDLNGDGRLDVVVRHGPRTLALLMDPAASPPGPPPAEVLTLPRAALDVAAGDFDTDGDLDLAVACQGGIMIIEQQEGLPFRRGDCNGDGVFNLADIVTLLTHVLAGAPVNCLDACDVDDNGSVQIGDAVILATASYAGGPPPAPPHPGCGPDPVTDTLGCSAYPGCP